ncbi:DUF2235 domain-containing protein [Bradyrhizobium sp.]|jgi:uncharacterized protein (DUF2235 family)|uniref:DUF2235 domain-containing protein n=1 Tax=Bradyrhizobium sp. TaxID=376 RepID=UPI003C16CF59
MKRIIVCCDGTWNADDTQTNDTNVALLARSIHGSQQTGGILQIVLYLRGVGTTGLKLETFIEGATGIGVDDNIRSAYQFISQNYIPGDEIYLFGFSRGAFTARSLAGLITACGILFRESLNALPDAWIYYRSPKPHSPAAFASKYQVRCHLDPQITLLGVWDTVGSLGIPGSLLAAGNKEKFAFHDTSPSPLLKHGVQALAIDERRHDFTPTFWTGTIPPGVTIQQVWFAGAHSDVGGGYKTRSLADIPLVWMAKQAEADGLALDWKCLPDPSMLDVTAPAHDSSSGLFALDRYHPTLRAIGMTKCAVKFNESLYEALDENGKPVSTINEGIHRSVLSRYAGLAQVCSDDDKGTCSVSPYKPETLTPFFSSGSFAGLPIVD